MDIKLILENQLALLLWAEQSLPNSVPHRQALRDAIDKTAERLKGWGEGARR